MSNSIAKSGWLSYDAGMGDDSKAKKSGADKGKRAEHAGKESSKGLRMLTAPAEFLNDAVKAVPATKWALMVGGIAATIAIIAGFGVGLRIEGWGIFVMLILMVLVLVFAKLTRAKTEVFHYPILVILWTSTVAYVGVAALLFTCVFFTWPFSLRTWLIDTKDSHESVPLKPFPPPSQTPVPSTPLQAPIQKEAELPSLNRAQSGMKMAPLNPLHELIENDILSIDAFRPLQNERNRRYVLECSIRNKSDTKPVNVTEAEIEFVTISSPTSGFHNQMIMNAVYQVYVRLGTGTVASKNGRYTVNVTTLGENDKILSIPCKQPLMPGGIDYFRFDVDMPELKSTRIRLQQALIRLKYNGDLWSQKTMCRF